MHNYTSNEIKDALLSVGVSSGDTIYCHSNIALFGGVKGYISKEYVCEAFYKSIMDVVGREGTLIVPTYTNSFAINQHFNSKTTKSKMGVFAEWVRNNNSSIRSLDPAYSVAAIGPKANYYCEDIPNNSFARGSVFDRILQQNAKILCLNHPGCTFLHFVERELKVPYRFDKSFNGKQMIDGALVEQTWKIWVRYMSDSKLIHTPKKYLQYIKDKLIGKYTNLGRGEVLLISALEVYKVVEIGLHEDPWFLINADKGDNTVIIDTKYK